MNSISINSIQCKPWPRMIALVDMNAFFAAIEQYENPIWRGRAIGITNGEEGSTLITASYEARHYGIETGTKLKQALKLCPHFIRVSARPYVYAQVSTKIMQAIQTYAAPEVEVFSVDEAFIDLTSVQKFHHYCPITIGQYIKKIVFQASGLLCSIGISGDKTTAKWAAKQQKPNGLTIIEPWHAKQSLQDVPVTKLCGINRGIGGFLAQYGVHTCGDMEKLPISILAKRFGHLGRRIWLMAQGLDPAPLQFDIKAPKSLGHGKVTPPNTTDKQTLQIYLRHMAEKVAARLRKHHLTAQIFFIGLRKQNDWLHKKVKSQQPTDDGKQIFNLTLFLLTQYWRGEGVYQVQITALDPCSKNQQKDFFNKNDTQREEYHQIMDSINRRYGELTIAPASLIKRSSMPNVIAPAWKPNGHRNTLNH